MDSVVIWHVTQGTWCFSGEYVENSSESAAEEQEVHIFYLQVFRMNESEKREKKEGKEKRQRVKEGRRKERKERKLV